MKLQVGVKILIESDDHFLLLERSGAMPSDNGWYWDIPGGRINEHEPLMEALAREVSEETGLRLIGEPQLCMAQDIFVDAADLHVVRLTYRGMANGDVILSSEHQSSKWVTMNELMHENIDPYLRKVLNNER